MASKPKLLAFVLIKPATYPAEDSTGTVTYFDFHDVVEFNVRV